MRADTTLHERIRVKELLQTVLHVPVATVNDDGSPLSSPVFAAFDEKLRMYWASNIDAQHSANIRRDARVFLVLFDSMEHGGGLYIEAQAHEIADENELKKAVGVVNKRRTSLGRAKASAADFSNDSVQKIYCAEPLKLWINVSRRNAEGRVLSDERVEIAKADLT